MNRRAKLRIRKHPNGIVTIITDNFNKSVDVRSMTPEEKFMAIKWAFLTEGVAFSEKIEKKVVKELFSK